MGCLQASSVTRVLRSARRRMGGTGGMFRPLWGGPANRAGAPAFVRSERGSLLLALTISLAACGGGSPSNANESEGPPGRAWSSAEFPSEQRLGQTSVMTLGVRNTGEKTVPSPGGDDQRRRQGGRDDVAALRDPRPAARPRPARPAGLGARRRLPAARPANRRRPEPGPRARKTYDFGPLKPGKTVEAIWKLSAVKAGKFAVLYRVAGGPRRQGEGGDRRRHHAGRQLTVRSPTPHRTPKSPTPARSSKSTEGGKGSKSGK